MTETMFTEDMTTDTEVQYLRGALERIADLGGAQGILARAALSEAAELHRHAAWLAEATR